MRLSCINHLNVQDDFTVAFLENNSTVGHVPQGISAGGYFLQKNGSERTLHHQWWFHASTSSRGKQEHLIVLFAKLQAKATELTTDSLTVIGWASLEL